jgi:hypothetical protein
VGASTHTCPWGVADHAFLCTALCPSVCCCCCRLQAALPSVFQTCTQWHPTLSTSPRFLPPSVVCSCGAGQVAPGCVCAGEHNSVSDGSMNGKSGSAPLGFLYPRLPAH